MTTPHAAAPLDASIRHIRSARGLMSVWRNLQQTVTSPAILHGLPPFVTNLASAFYDVQPDHVVMAVRRGDPALFVACLLRIDQLDVAMIAAGRTEAERTPLISARFTVDGFLQSAKRRLEIEGGTWPPVVQSSSTTITSSRRSSGKASPAAAPLRR